MRDSQRGTIADRGNEQPAWDIVETHLRAQHGCVAGNTGPAALEDHEAHHDMLDSRSVHDRGRVDFS